MIRVNLISTAPGQVVAAAPARDWFPKEQRAAAMGLALPYDLARPGVEREELIAHLVRLGRELDVASDDALQDLLVGQALLLQLRGEVVAVDPRRCGLERP